MKSDETIIPVILFTMYLYEQLFQNDELLIFFIFTAYGVLL